MEIILNNMLELGFLVLLASMLLGFFVGVTKGWESITFKGCTTTRSEGWIYVSCIMIPYMCAGIFFLSGSFLFQVVVG